VTRDRLPCGEPWRPDPHHVRTTFAWAIVTLVILIAGVIAMAVR
jgi:hypothetical protein